MLLLLSLLHVSKTAYHCVHFRNSLFHPLPPTSLFNISKCVTTALSHVLMAS